MFGQRGGRVVGAERDAEFQRDGRRDQRVFGDRCERHPEPPAGEVAPSGRDPHREPRLADAAAAGDRHETRAARAPRRVRRLRRSRATKLEVMTGSRAVDVAFWSRIAAR